MNDTIDIKARYETLIGQVVKRTNVPEMLKQLQQQGAMRFAELGIPPKRDERYKYSSVEALFNREYKNITEPLPFHFNVDEIFKCDVPALETHVALVINGFYYDKNPTFDLPKGVTICSLTEALAKHPKIIEAHLGKYATLEDGLSALNAALATDGVFVHVAAGVQMNKPLQIVNLLLSPDNLLVHQRNLIVVDEAAVADIIVCDHSLSPALFIANESTEIYAAQNAVVSYLRLQNEHKNAAHITHTFVQQEASSSVSCNTITLHGGLIRNNLKVMLNGEFCENHSLGLYFADETESVDNHTFINHLYPNCTSNQLFKGILGGTASGAFTGRIYVSKDAQKTLAYQKNSNLLLTSEAKTNSRPQLEIYADDVKCSHGATVGQLDNEAMFYLQSRGIGKDEARMLLMFAFAHEIIDYIKSAPLKARIDDMVNRRLRGELGHCGECRIQCG